MNDPVIFGITGPTASGKTNLGVLLAKTINAEIISVDSAQVYKKLDIGTAKPTINQTKGVRHHLIDIVEPWQSYSVQHFLDDAKACIAKIHARNKHVLLVGGTMLYFKALIEGLSPLPSANQTLRHQLKNTSLKKLHQFLSKHDPETANQLSANDRQRIERAVEVTMIAQQPYSHVVKSKQKTGGLGRQIKLCALVPKERQQLHKKIAERFHSILEKGFLDEVKALKNHPLVTDDLPAMRSVGYRQAWQHLDGQYDYDSFVAKSIAATRQLAKRQLTWIRNWPTRIKLFEFDQNGYFDSDRLCQYFSTISRSLKYSL